MVRNVLAIRGIGQNSCMGMVIISTGLGGKGQKSCGNVWVGENLCRNGRERSGFLWECVF